MVLSMTSEDRRNRVLNRHDGDVDAADKMDVGSLDGVGQTTLWIMLFVAAFCEYDGAGAEE